MSRFAAKKAQRDVKQSNTFINENVSESNGVQYEKGGSQMSSFDKAEKPHDDATIPTAPTGLYTDLPSSLNIRKYGPKGRGLCSTVTITKGSIILKTTPFIYVLSIPTLSSYCSYCTKAACPNLALKRCTKCKQIWYCSSTCQTGDWKLHRNECSAIMRWMSSSPDSSLPPEVVRVLGRILFARKVTTNDNSWRKEIQQLQSNQSSLPPSAAESFTQLAHALVRYLGVTSPTELEPYGLHSAKDIVGLISRFTINAFTLTSPSLSSLGVCLSPVASLLNHSCQPNAVVVFPGSGSTKSNHTQPALNVIALRDILPDEEILISYVDVTFATSNRQKYLKDTYSFTCSCSLCSKTTFEADQREAVLCPKNCGGKCVASLALEKPLVWDCPSCHATYSSNAIDKVENKRHVGQEALDKALKLQYSDPEQALKLTTKMIPLLSNDLPPSAHPYLNILRLHETLLTDKLSSSDSTILDDTIRTAGLVVTGLTGILEKGHPILAIALVELGKLLAVDEPPETIDTTFDFPPRGPQRLILALEILKRALENLTIGFGKESGGGEIGIQVRENIVKLEKEAQAWNHGIRNVLQDTILQQKHEQGTKR